VRVAWQAHGVPFPAHRPRARPALAVLLALVAAACTPAAAPAQGHAEKGEIWISRDELKRLPTAGPAWDNVARYAEEPLGDANLSDQDSEHDVHVFAAALAYARTGAEHLRRKAATGIMDAIGTEDGGRTLALARGLLSYVVAADLIDLDDFDRGKGRVFTRWLTRVRNERLEPDSRPTLVLTHERAANNWGTHAGASRIAADAYLGDRADLARAAAVFRGFVGDRKAFDGFNFGDDQSWQLRPERPVGIVAAGARKHGMSIDGALPDDMRRGCAIRTDPCPTRYPWEAMQGIVAQAELLSRQGYDSWEWEDQAVRRAARFLFDLNRRRPHEDWSAPEGHQWVPWLLNARYGDGFPTALPAQPGKGMGFTDWTHAQSCERRSCTEPRGERRVPVAVKPRPDPARSREAAREEDGDTAILPIAAAAVVTLVLAAAALVLGRSRRSRAGRGGRRG
jgi:hypothetical protein